MYKIDPYVYLCQHTMLLIVSASHSISFTLVYFLMVHANSECFAVFLRSGLCRYCYFITCVSCMHPPEKNMCLVYNLCLVYVSPQKKIEPRVLGTPRNRDVTTIDKMQVVYL